LTHAKGGKFKFLMLRYTKCATAYDKTIVK